MEWQNEPKKIFWFSLKNNSKTENSLNKLGWWSIYFLSFRPHTTRNDLFICPALLVSNTLLSHSLPPPFYLLCGPFYGFRGRGSPLLPISSHRVAECLWKLGESSMEINRTPTPFPAPLQTSKTLPGLNHKSRDKTDKAALPPKGTVAENCTPLNCVIILKGWWMGARCTAHTEQSVLGEVGTYYYSSLSIKSANKAIT